MMYRIPGGLFSTSEFIRLNRLRKWDKEVYAEARRWLEQQGLEKIKWNNGTYWRKRNN